MIVVSDEEEKNDEIQTDGAFQLVPPEHQRAVKAVRRKEEEEQNLPVEPPRLVENEKSFLLNEESPSSFVAPEGVCVLWFFEFLCLVCFQSVSKEDSPEGDKESSADEQETPEPVGFLTGLGMALGITRPHSVLTEV